MARLERQLYDAAKSNTGGSTVAVTENSGVHDGSRNDSLQQQRQEGLQRGSPPQNSGSSSLQSSNTARSWVTAVHVSQDDDGSVVTSHGSSVAEAAQGSSKNPRWRDAPNRRRASYPDEMGEKYNEPRYIPNQLPRSSKGRTSMRQTLEMQQRVATAVIGNASKQVDTFS